MCILVGIYLLCKGMGNLGIRNLSTLYSLGFGAIDTNAVINVGPSNLLGLVLLANLPQGILSFVYLTYNALFTCMISAHEWARFADKKVPLRVTSPVGQQKSTYYLQLPYYYSLVRNPFCMLQVPFRG
jgi:hypothetical protein